MKACADETQNECKTERSTSCTMEKVTHCKGKHKKQCDMMGQKWDMVREFISQSGDTMNDETRTRLQRLEASFASRQRRRHILTRGRTSSLASPRGFDLLHSGQSQQCECCQRRLH